MALSWASGVAIERQQRAASYCPNARLLLVGHPFDHETLNGEGPCVPVGSESAAVIALAFIGNTQALAHFLHPVSVEIKDWPL